MSRDIVINARVKIVCRDSCLRNQLADVVWVGRHRQVRVMLLEDHGPFNARETVLFATGDLVRVG